MKSMAITLFLCALVFAGCAVQPRTVPEVRGYERKPDGKIVATIQNRDVSFTNAMVATNMIGNNGGICERPEYANSQPLVIEMGASIPGRLQVNHKQAIMICPNGNVYEKFQTGDVLTYYAEFGSVIVEFIPKGLPPVRVPITPIMNTSMSSFMFYNFGYAMSNVYAGMTIQFAKIDDNLLLQNYGPEYGEIVKAVRSKRSDALMAYYLDDMKNDTVVQQGWAIQRNGGAEQREITVSEIPVRSTGKTATLYMSRPVRGKAPEDAPKRSLDEGAHVMHGSVPAIQSEEASSVRSPASKPKKSGLGGRCTPGGTC